MNQLFENKFYRFLLLWATLAAVLAYAWVGSKMMAPRFMLPQSVASIVILEEGHAKTLDEALASHAYMLSRATKELEQFDSAIQLIGGLSVPADLLINFDDPFRYLVTESRVELGSGLLGNRGQLAKALTKSWLYQRARPDLSASILRIEVVSDLLWSMLNGSLDLEVPEQNGRLAFPETSPWLLFASPFRAHCESPWRSMELHRLCEIQKSAEAESSDSIHSTSFRPLLGAMVWNVYQRLSLLDRIGFLKAWVSWLIAGSQAEEPQRPEAIGQWKAWLRSEFERLLPPHVMTMAGLKEPENFTALIDRTLAQADLGDQKGFDVDFVFRSKAASPENVRLLANVIAVGNEKIWKTTTVALVETAKGIFTLPGLARLSDASDSEIRSHHLVWEACVAPSVRDIIEDPIRAQRVLYVRACREPLGASYSPLVSMGIQGFAIANPGATFALMRRPSVELAASKHLLLLHRSSILNDLLERSRKVDDASTQLGLRDAKWNPDLRAYRVLGAVEAVEWYRAEVDSPAASLPQ